MLHQRTVGAPADDARPHKFLSLPVCEEKNGSAVGMVYVMDLPDPGLRRGKRGLALDLFGLVEYDGQRRGRRVGRREAALDGQHRQKQHSKKSFVDPSKKAAAMDHERNRPP